MTALYIRRNTTHLRVEGQNHSLDAEGESVETKRDLNVCLFLWSQTCPLTVRRDNYVLPLRQLTLRRLMSYIYEAPILDVSRSHTTTQHSR